MITINQIEQAYQETKLIPSKGVYFLDDKACAIGALYRAEGYVGNDPCHWAVNKFGSNWFFGFTTGWDGGDVSIFHNKDLLEGYEIGKSASNHFFKKLPKKQVSLLNKMWESFINYFRN